MTVPERPRPAAVAFVLVSVGLDVMALGLIIPVLPHLVGEMAGSIEGGAVVFGVFGTAWALMQFAFSPVLGALSDAVGRRPVLLLSSLGLGLDYIVMALAPNLGWLFAGRIVSGITAATFSTASAYIADVTPPAERAGKFGLIGAAFGLGFVLGPAIGGLLGSADPRLPFWVAAALSLLCTAYGYFVLPESHPRERRTPFAWSRANPVGALKLLGSERQLGGLAVAKFLFDLAHAVFPAVFVLHAAYRLGWGAGMVGLALAVFGICAAIVQGALVKPAVARFGERTMVTFGMLAGIAGLLTMAFAHSAEGFFTGMLLISLWGFIGPSMQGLMSGRVDVSRQGQLQGALSSLMGVASLIGPSLFTGAFALGIRQSLGAPLPGAPYVMAAVSLLLALVLARWVTKAAPVTAQGG